MMAAVTGLLRAVALAGLGTAVLAGAAAAQQVRPGLPARVEPPPPLVRVASGSWDVTDQKTRLVCRVILNVTPAAKGYALAATPNCRRRVSVLVPVQSWTLEEDQSIVLFDKDGAEVAAFKPDATRHAWRATVNGITNEMKAVGQTGEGERSDVVAKALTESRLPDLPALNPASLPGLYSVGREKNKPVCSIDLAATPAGRRGHFGAKLSGGCIDNGLKVFDPVSWYTERGRLYLVARKGHEQRLAADKDGIFQKDPPTGAQLFLKKQ